MIDYEQFCGSQAETPQGPEITPEALKARLDRGEDIFILDVREPHEYQLANLGGRLIPLSALPGRLTELDATREIIVHCKLGGRSAKAVDLLRKAGFSNVKNLIGGIDAWAQRIDRTMRRY